MGMRQMKYKEVSDYPRSLQGESGILSSHFPTQSLALYLQSTVLL